MAATSGPARTWFEDSSPDYSLESFNSGQKSSTPPSRLLSTHLICCVFEYVCSQSILLHPTCHLFLSSSSLSSSPPVENIPYKHIFSTIRRPKLLVACFLLIADISFCFIMRRGRLEALACFKKYVFAWRTCSPSNLTDLKGMKVDLL